MDKRKMPKEMPGHRTSAGVIAVIRANRESVVLREHQKRDPRLAPNTHFYWHDDACVPFGD